MWAMWKISNLTIGPKKAAANSCRSILKLLQIWSRDPIVGKPSTGKFHRGYYRR